MLEIFFSSPFFSSVHALVEFIIRVSIYMFTLGVIMYFISLVFRLVTDTEGKDHVYHLFFVGFGALGLATYQIWAIWLGKLFVLLARAIFDLQEGNIMSQYLGAFFQDGGGSDLQVSLFNMFSLETLSSLSYLLVMIVYEIFVVIQVIVQIFMYLIGPLAIVVSLFPTFRDVFKVWITNFCAVNFWSVLVAILFRLVQTLLESTSFQTAVENGDKSVLWNSFILGVILCIIIVLIPKISLAIFRGGSVAADMGTYGTAITAGVVISTVWQRLKVASVTASQTFANRTGTGVISGAQAMARSGAGSATQSAMQNLGGGGEAVVESAGKEPWPFEGTRVPNTDRR